MAAGNAQNQPPDTALPSLVDFGVLETPLKAYERVGGEYDHWSGKLTDSSLQMCYALIGANWVVFGSVGNILNSNWAKFSLLMVMLTLMSNLVGSWWASEAHRKRLEYAEADSARWAAEFNSATGTRTPWPFTARMERAGYWMRQIKGACPLIGALLLIVGAIVK
jgi:hypothetical protein